MSVLTIALTLLSYLPPSFRLPSRRLPLRAGSAVRLYAVLSSGILCAAEVDPKATAGWEAFSPPPASMNLQAEGAQRAKALALFSKALREERRGNKESALASYKAARDLDAHNVRLASRMANLMAGMGKFNDALALLEQTKADNLTEPQAWLELSRYCRRHHHDALEIKTKALQYAKQAVEAFPATAETLVHLIDTYFTLQVVADGDPRGKAREVLERAEQAASEDPAFWMELVPSVRSAYPLDDAETRAANLEMLLRFVSKAERFAGTDDAICLRLAYFYHEYAKKLKSITLAKRALPWFEKLTAAHPENLPARREYAALLRQLGEADRATKMFQELVAINPQDLESRRALIKVAEQAQDSRALITHRSEILRWQGGTAQEWLDLSQAMIKEQQLDAAVVLLKRARFAHPEDATLIAQLAKVYQAAGQDFSGFDSFQAGLNLAEKHPDEKDHPRNAKLLKDAEFYFLGATLAARQPNQTDLATQWFRHALEVAPKDSAELTARCYFGLASLWLERNDQLDAAGELLRTADSLVPDNAGYVAALGWLAFKQQEFPDALEKLEKAAKLSKENDPQILSQLSQCLVAQHRPEDALKYARMAAEHTAATAEIKQRLAELQSQPKQ